MVIGNCWRGELRANVEALRGGRDARGGSCQGPGAGSEAKDIGRRVVDASNVAFGAWSISLCCSGEDNKGGGISGVGSLVSQLRVCHSHLDPLGSATTHDHRELSCFGCSNESRLSRDKLFFISCGHAHGAPALTAHTIDFLFHFSESGLHFLWGLLSHLDHVSHSSDLQHRDYMIQGHRS